MLITETSNGQSFCYVRNVDGDDFGVAGNCTCTNSNATPCELLPDLSPSFLDTENNYEFDYPEIKFRTTVANIGEGPLEMKFNGLVFCEEPSANLNDAVSAAYEFAGGGSNDDFVCEGSAGLAYPLVDQIIYRMGGDYIREPAGYTEYTHGNHDHLHWANWAITSLRIGDANNRQNFANWPVVVRGEKTGFALVDYVVVSPAGAYIKNCFSHPELCLTENVSGMTTSNQATIANQNFGGMLNAPNCNFASTNNVGFDCFYSQDYHVTEAEVISSSLFGGISAGNFDTYTGNLDGQSLEFGNGCNGTYFLVTEVDPENKIRESDETNNTSVAEISITNSKDPNTGAIISSDTAPANSITTDMVITELTIKANDTFTISNCTVEFTDKARIVVEKGAKLIIDQAILTTVCDQIFWEGIQVWGDENIPHPSIVTENGNYTDHGVVIIKNNSSIQNASNAVKTIKVDNYGQANQTADLTNTNGIVIVKDSEFYNNICSVILTGDNKQTSCKIENTNFTIDDAFHKVTFTHINNHDPDFQLWMKYVVGLDITNATFDNQATAISAQDAIRAYKSTFKYLTNADPNNLNTNSPDSRINNFEKGIEAIYNFQNQQTQTLVKDVTFNNTPRSMAFSGYDDQFTNPNAVYVAENIGLYITDNTINLPNVWNGEVGSDFLENRWGIKLEGCNDYIVSNNTIKGGWVGIDEYGNNNLPFYPILVRESASTGTNVYNYIQNNTIGGNSSKFNVNILAYQDNPSLQILCNTHEDFTSQYDIYYFDSGTQGPAAEYQGACGDVESLNPETGPAGNDLATPNTPPVPNVSHTQLAKFGSANNYNIKYSYVNMPSQISGGIILDECDGGIEVECGAYDNGSFTVEIDDGGGTDPDPINYCCNVIARSAYMDIETDMQAAMELLTKYNRIDDSALIDVTTDMNEVLNIVSEYDVYLSNGELAAVSGKLILSTAYQVINILEENAPLNNDVLQALTNQINSLTLVQRFWLKRHFGNQINNLYKYTSGISLRQEKEKEVYQLSIEQKYVIPTVSCCKTAPFTNLFELNYAANNTSLNKVWFQQLLVEYATEYNLYRYAQFALSQINTIDNEELADYVALKQLHIKMQMQGKDLEDLSENEIALLENLANTNTIAGISARNAILAINDSLPVNEILQLPTEQSFKKAAKPSNPLLSLEVPVIDALVYPTPAKDILYINNQILLDFKNEIEVNIYNLNGILINSFNVNSNFSNSLDISKIDEGAYVVEVRNEYEIIDQTKILIIK